MSLKIGIVGLPNVGKSTLFKALTKKDVIIENYPFATIDPNVGVVEVPDERLWKLSGMSQSIKTVPTVIEFVDIAGLVKNAHQGEGLGNQFLANIREVDAIAHVVRGFTDENIHHVEESINPSRDQETIHLELVMADLATVEKRLHAVKNKATTGNKEAHQFFSVYEKLKTVLNAGALAITAQLSDSEQELIRDLNLLTLKPHFYICNVKDGTVPSSLVLTEHDRAVPIDIKEELEISGLSRDERKELGIGETGLDRIIQHAYQLLGLVTFFTTGEKESRAWTVTQGTAAPQAAGEIHTDFEKKFIKAEIINWQTLLSCNSWNRAKEQGLIRTEGKEYNIQDGDVIFFKI